MSFKQFSEYLKLGCFDYKNFLSTFFEDIQLEFKCYRERDFKYVINLVDIGLEDRINAMGVYVLPVFTSIGK